MSSESLTKFYGVFDHFSRSYEVAEFWMIRRSKELLGLDGVSTYVTSSPWKSIYNMLILDYVWNFGIFGFMLFCLWQKNHFTQNLLLWSQVPLKELLYCKWQIKVWSDLGVKSICIRSYSGSHFPALGLNMDIYSVSLRIQSQCGEMRTRITPTTDTFHAVTLNIIMNLEKYPHCHFHFFG